MTEAICVISVDNESVVTPEFLTTHADWVSECTIRDNLSDPELVALEPSSEDWQLMFTEWDYNGDNQISDCETQKYVFSHMCLYKEIELACKEVPTCDAWIWDWFN